MRATRVLIGWLAAGLWMSASLARAAAASGEEWPCFRGPHHDGRSPDTGLLKEWPQGGPKQLWKVDTIGHGYSSVAVSGGQVLTTGDLDGKLVLFAFDLEGKLKWKVPVDAAWTRDHPGSRATPTIDGGKAYLLSGNGVVACHSAKTGARLWTRKMSEFGGGVPGWGYAESVLILGRLAIVTPGGRSCIVALDKTTGGTVWKSAGFEGPANYGSCFPFTFNKTPLIAAGTGGGIVCVDARTGRVQWSDAFSAGNTANCPSPIYSDGFVFWANGYGKGGLCLELSSGAGRPAKRAWTTSDMDCHHGGYIIDGGYLYGNNGGGWACLDLKTGRRKWTARGVGKGSICYADGMLYLFSEGGGEMGLATCSPDGLEMKGTFRVNGNGPSWAHPVVIGGRLYLRYDTNLYCFDVKAK